jgi:hypothetical protein
MLARYASPGNYTDCFTADVPVAVAQADFVRVFYSSWAFRPERLLLKLVLGKGATAADVAELAAGKRAVFAAWSVEEQTASELLLCDYQGLTRSWLMAAPLGDGQSTRLHFGSAVVPRGRQLAGATFRALTWFHRAYSRVLLYAAAAKLAVKPS